MKSKFKTAGSELLNYRMWERESAKGLYRSLSPKILYYESRVIKWFNS